jgi:hydrogenase maturation protein HypF
MARDLSGLHEVALSGGVWQNHLLLELTLPALRAERFEVYTHKRTPTNDGGLAFGQAVVAAERMA